jgi:hypothetical protein
MLPGLRRFRQRCAQARVSRQSRTVTRHWPKGYGVLAGMLVVLGIAAGSACVGDDPSTTPTSASGDRGGSCFANGTCNGGGLVCVDGYRLLPGDPSRGPDAGSDGSVAPSEASAPVDADADHDALTDAGSPCAPPGPHDA